MRYQRAAMLTTWVAGVTGMIEGLLMARFVARLLAARPENPAIALLYYLTNVLTGPLSILDQSQPRFGAVLELATLASMLLVALVGFGLYAALLRGRPRAAMPAGGANDV